MTTVHRLTGYERKSEELVFEYDIPPSKLRHAKELANVPRSDPHAAGSYPLDASQTRQIARLVNQMVNVDRYSWFLEPFDESVGADLPAA